MLCRYWVQVTFEMYTSLPMQINNNTFVIKQTIRDIYEHRPFSASINSINQVKQPMFYCIRTKLRLRQVCLNTSALKVKKSTFTKSIEPKLFHLSKIDTISRHPKLVEDVCILTMKVHYNKWTYYHCHLSAIAPIFRVGAVGTLLPFIFVTSLLLPNKVTY